MTARCVECGTEIDDTEKRGCKKYCTECAYLLNIERTKERYHKCKDGGWHIDPEMRQTDHYFKVISLPPGQEDLCDLQLTNVDFKYGDYSYLAGAVFQKGETMFEFDGKRARRRE